MGKVSIEIELINHADEILAENKVIPVEKVRTLKLNQVLVDTGATTLCLPKNFIEQLGLKINRKVIINTATGDYLSSIYQDVKLTIKGRSGVVECVELPDDRPPLLGVIPMEMLGLEIDLIKHELKLLPDFNSDTYILALNIF